MTEERMTLSLDAEKYGNFLRCITNLREVCNDVDLRGGVIRQRSNDKSTVFQMDLRPILNDQEVDMPISDIKKKLELLKIFSGQEVTITFVEDSFSFADDVTTIRFKNPTLEYMDNKFLSMEYFLFLFGESFVGVLSSCNLFFIKYFISSVFEFSINILISSFERCWSSNLSIR